MESLKQNIQLIENNNFLDYPGDYTYPIMREIYGLKCHLLMMID